MQTKFYQIVILILTLIFMGFPIQGNAIENLPQALDKNMKSYIEDFVKMMDESGCSVELGYKNWLSPSDKYLAYELSFQRITIKDDNSEFCYANIERRICEENVKSLDGNPAITGDGWKLNSCCFNRSADAGPTIMFYFTKKQEEKTASVCGDKTIVYSFKDRNQDKEINIWRSGKDAFAFSTIVRVNVDGSPNAYNESDTGIDYICNAGLPYKPDGSRLRVGEPNWNQYCKDAFEKAKNEGFAGPTKFEWWGIVVDKNNVPIKQSDDDPFPGYYVSTTALFDPSIDTSKPSRYVDSTQIPYVVLPPKILNNSELGVALGDLATVYDPKTEKYCHAIVADIGVSYELGEGSVALIEALGHNPYYNNRANRGINYDVTFLIFPKSGIGIPMTIDEINQKTKILFDNWGGLSKLKACINQQ